MKKLLCFLKLHDWSYSGPEFESQMSLDLGIPEQPARRCCKRCQKKQTLTVLSINLYTGDSVRVWGNDK